MFRTTVALCAVCLAGAGCNSMLAPEDVAGSYSTIRFEFAQADEVTDVLAAGGRLDITLYADGTTSGELFVPASVNPGGQDLTADLAGTFVITDDIIDFTQSADTFVRNVDWAPNGKRILGGGVIDGVTIVVELYRN